MRRNSYYFFLTIFLLLALSACVNTRTTSVVVGNKQATFQRIALILKTGTFAGGNTASSLGQRNLNSLIPNLQSRLPVVFTLNGIPTRLASTTVGPDGPNFVKLEPNESLVVVTPISATYSSQAGQSLILQAELVDRAAGSVTWRATIRMATLGFGKFDDKVANDVAIQILEKMREDNITRLPDGPFITAPKTGS
jgi:hypothetical protein